MSSTPGLAQDDKTQFIAQCPPFNALDDSQLAQCLKLLNIAYFKAGESQHAERNDILKGRKAPKQQVYLLRSGSVELRDDKGEFFDRLSVGDCFLFPVVGDEAALSLHWLEDSLVYLFPQSLPELFAGEHTSFAQFFGLPSPTEHYVAPELSERDFRLNQAVSELMAVSPLCTHENASIEQAASAMAEARVSSILVLSDKALVGILTDRDLRTRVLAKGVPATESVAKVMTSAPQCISPDDTVYTAQMMMMRENIHHLPVVDAEHPVGILALNDVVRAQNSEPIYMIQAIHRSSGREALYRIARRLPELICKMIKANVRADEIGRVITSITDATTQQLIKLARRSFGPEPCRYAWVVFGSQARQDQMLGSDQDNGLILENDVDEAAQAYFKRFAEFVNEGLDRSGLKYCPGGIMAMTDKWRQPLSQWQAYFLKWIRQPEPKALMHASIFYDIRHLAGDAALTQALVDLVLDEAGKNTIFQACMLDNALEASPPLGFFKKFVLEKDGNHHHVLDLKIRGTVPIVAALRLYCLANNISAVNTQDRIKVLRERELLSLEEAQNLSDAHEFIASLRLENQSHAIEQDEAVSNNLDPDDLSPLVRRQLKDAFSTVAESQRLLKMRFGHGAI